jgi:acetyl esterase
MIAAKGPPKARSLFRAMVALSSLLWAQLPSAPVNAQEVSVVEKVRFSDVGDLSMDVYMPSGEGPFPGVMVIHGGGWYRGGTSWFAEEAQYLAERGFVAFAITYRLAPEDPFPAPLEDVQTAVEFVRAHSEEFNLDPNRVGALGGSAGGHLAAMLATVGEGDRNEGSRIAAAVSWSGPMDLAVMVQQSRNPEKVATRTSDFLACDLVNDFDGCQEVLREASPISYVDSTDAPLFFTNAEREPIPIQQAVLMDEALADADVEHELVEIPGRCHSRSCENMQPSALGGATVIEASTQWLEQWLMGEPAPTVENTGQGDGGNPRAGDRRGGGRLPVALLLAILGIAALLVVLVVAAQRRRRSRAGTW